ncbi:type II toxin-antitoxin system death-on-curing family toxin [Nocardiopsis aegyptia]|uniref:Death-on-curing protein n=1 Tax=Nocardiopsis aegyptia TaxID=220378 RepID=A0A7Z0JCC0_9ACTN|nr:Fic family protein [Nocardiopsis aegyptia]NYJ36300.1 death-on-curing protein [Nocardiopsis aegyptia]
MSDDDPIFLTRQDLLALIQDLLPPSVTLRDPGQLHAAVLRPQTSAFGEDAYPGLWEKAAALMQSILIGHPLSDGNKRLAWLAAKVFLRYNRQCFPPVDTTSAYDLVIAVTTGELEDVPDIADRLRKLAEADQ